MGALHQGHLDLGGCPALLPRTAALTTVFLVKASLARHPLTVMTLFVNPMQVSHPADRAETSSPRPRIWTNTLGRSNAISTSSGPSCRLDRVPCAGSAYQRTTRSAPLTPRLPQNPQCEAWV
jgi:hypothetical protein